MCQCVEKLRQLIDEETSAGMDDSFDQEVAEKKLSVNRDLFKIYSYKAEVVSNEIVL